MSLTPSGTLPTLVGSNTAQAITATSAATANTIATITNPDQKFTQLVLNITNLSAIAFTDFVIRTKFNPADSGYQNVYAGSTDYTDPAGYLISLTTDPTLLVSGTVQIVMSIIGMSSIQIAACVASPAPGTTASASWWLT